MEKQIDDGGPAYPAQFEKTDHPAWHQSEGMSLRDWFAGQALQGLMASCVHEDTPDPQYAARSSYRYADAMIAARKSGGGS
jgi:hypothetical protein